jgi:hypothetical protein
MTQEIRIRKRHAKHATKKNTRKKSVSVVQSIAKITRRKNRREIKNIVKKTRTR